LDAAEAVKQAVEALRAGKPALAAELLGPVVDDVRGDDMNDVRARVLTLYAQSLVDTGRTDEADPFLQEALELATGLGDEQGVVAIRELLERCAAASADLVREAQRKSAAARLAGVPIDELLARAGSDRERSDIYLRKADASLAVGRVAESALFAVQALAMAQAAGAVREEVLARLSLARAVPTEAADQIAKALDRARDENEANLVAAIAKTAELLGVPIPGSTP
jgi:hypothetical protein